MRPIRTVTASVVAGILSAFLFVGVGGRAAMKFIALITGHQLSFSIEGTIAALVFSTSIGIVGGMLFPLVQRYLPGSPKAKGGSFGLMVFVVLIPALPPPIHQEALILGEYVSLAVAVFGLLLMGYGIVLEALARALLKISREQTSVRPDNSYSVHRNPRSQSTHYKHTSRSIQCEVCDCSP